MLAYFIIAFFILLFRCAGVFRLGIPLLYALIVPTLFHEWYYAHYTFANGIWYAMLVLVVVSWIMTIIQEIQEILCQSF